MYVLMFAATFAWEHFSKKKWARYDEIYTYWYSCNVPSFFVWFSKITEMSNFMKIRSVLAELFHSDTRTDGLTDWHDETGNRFFRNFANAPKNSIAKKKMGDRSVSPLFSCHFFRLGATTEQNTLQDKVKID